jgi:hypothetical protein
MPIPALLLVGGGAIAFARIFGQSEPEHTESDPPAEDETETADPQPVTAALTPTTWDDLLNELCGSLPVDFLQRWITRESAGNACSVGSIAQMNRDGYAREAGIGQVYFESPTQRVFGVTSNELRAYCAPGTQNQTRDLTDDERRAQVQSLVSMATAFLAAADSKLAAQGLSWETPDRLALAKLHHGLPAIPKSLLPAANRAGRAGSWSEFRDYCSQLTADVIDSIDHGITAYLPIDRFFTNAAYTGGL